MHSIRYNTLFILHVCTTSYHGYCIHNMHNIMHALYLVHIFYPMRPSGRLQRLRWRRLLPSPLTQLGPPSALALLLVLLIAATLPAPTSCGMTESHRLLERKRRAWTWPFRFSPSTPGWRALIERRLDQVARIEDSTKRYNGYTQASIMAAVAPNFTENGCVI